MSVGWLPQCALGTGNLALTAAEIVRFGLLGQDPAWEEWTEANNVKAFGAERWKWIKKCQDRLGYGKTADCFRQAYKVYPEK